MRGPPWGPVTRGTRRSLRTAAGGTRDRSAPQLSAPQLQALSWTHRPYPASLVAGGGQSPPLDLQSLFPEKLGDLWLVTVFSLRVNKIQRSFPKPLGCDSQMMRFPWQLHARTCARVPAHAHGCVHTCACDVHDTLTPPVSPRCACAHVCGDARVHVRVPMTRSAREASASSSSPASHGVCVP